MRTGEEKLIGVKRFMAASKVLGEETIAGSQQKGGSET